MVTRHTVVCCVRCGCSLGSEKRCDLCCVVHLSHQALAYERLLTRGKAPYWKRVSDSCYAVKECVLGKEGVHGVCLAKVRSLLRLHLMQTLSVSVQMSSDTRRLVPRVGFVPACSHGACHCGPGACDGPDV